MLIGICSDTHDHIENIRKAVRFFKEKGVDKVIHSGDYCSPFTIPLFEGLPIEGIFGNNDGDKLLLIKKFQEIGGIIHGDFFSFEADKLRFAVYHGTYPEITQSLEKSSLFDVVITGHTHQAGLDTINGVLSINPGSVNGFDGDAMVAVFDTVTRQVQFKELK
jgi:uncharacterized protein